MFSSPAQSLREGPASRSHFTLLVFLTLFKDLGFDNGCIAKGCTEAAMCVKWWLQKCYLEKRNITRFFHHWKILPRLKLWLLLVEFFFISTLHVVRTKILLCDLHNFFQIFFLLNFSTSWTSLCKRTLTQEFFPRHDLSPWNHDRSLSPQRTRETEYVYIFWWRNHKLKQ